MIDELTMSNINLFAVLRNLEDLGELDDETKKVAAERNISIAFQVKDGADAVLTIHNGKFSLTRGKGKSNIKLYFFSPAHLNKMFEGKAKPIPLKGFTKISFLTNEFTKLTDRLSYFLKPTENLLQNPVYQKINTILTANTAFFALAEIGNYDRVGKMNASRIDDGVISISVLNGGPAINITAKDGRLQTAKGAGISPRAYMSFSNMETANAILNGKLDSYTCIGTGDFQVKGFIPMLDNMNKLLYQVPSYLKQ